MATSVRKFDTVRKLLANRKRWCQHAMAMDANSVSVPTYSKEAVKWCLVGALKHVYGDNTHEYFEARQKIEKVIANTAGYCIASVTSFNDTTEFSKVKEVLRAANV